MHHGTPKEQLGTAATTTSLARAFAPCMSQSLSYSKNERLSLSRRGGFLITALLVRLCFFGIYMSAAVASALARSTTGIVRHTRMAPAIATSTELTLQCSDGMTLAAQSWKQAGTDEHEQQTVATKQRILCLHGWMDNCRSFHLLAPAIMESLPSSTELVALDFPGHGWSGHKSADGPPVLLAETAVYIAEAIEQLEWHHESTPFTLIGHSMGAAVSCVYAAAFPEQVDRVILLEGAGPLARNPSDIAKHVRAHVNRRVQANRLNKGPRVYPDLAKAVETRCLTAKNFPGNQWLSQEAAQEMVLRGSRPVETGGLQFRHDPRLQWPSLQYFSEDQTEALYRDIQCPTALILAENGWPFDDERRQRTLELLQPSMVAMLPGSHHFHADPETATDVTAKVLEFLQKQHAEEG